MENILEIKNLRKNFKGFSLKDISFSLPKGYIMGFIGPNGAGKSTTIKLIMNLLKKDAGEIKIFGKDHIKYEKEIKNKIGFVYDQNYFYEELTVEKMKNIIRPVYSEWDDELFNKYLHRFNLSAKKKIKELSKGMQMKFSLAIALSHNADFIIMDEPTSGLDPVVRRELLDILFDLIQDENKGIFFSTHITSDLDKIADYITFIKDGEIVLSTTKDEIFENYGIVKGDNELLNDDLKKEFIGFKENRYGFEALVNDREKMRRLFREDVLIEKPSLEDIMVYYARGVTKMLNLIKKEFIIQKKSMLFGISYSVFAIFVFQKWPLSASIVSALAITYVLMANAFILEEKNKTEIIIASFPITRKDIVLAKYLSAFAYSFYGIFSCWLVSMVIKIFSIPVKVESISLIGILRVSFLVGLMISIFLPLSFKFGYRKMKIVNMFMFLLMFFIPGFSIEYINKNPDNKFVIKLLNMVSKSSDWQVSTYIIILTLLFVFISYIISLKIYQNKEF